MAAMLTAPAKRMLDAAFHSWQLDTLALAEATENRPLSVLAVYLFDRLGLVDKFGLDREKLTCFMQKVEDGLDDSNRYHNRAHVASVLHFMHAMLHHGRLAEATATAYRAEAVDQSADIYADEDLVTMACLFAAAVHDYEHLGLSSDFLVKTGHARALRYKNEHVNENHHVAAAFALLLRPECDFLSSLPSAVFRHLRGMVAELVIATDMKENEKLVEMFKAILMSNSMQVSADRHLTLPAFAPATSNEAVLLLQIALKCSDIGHLALDWELHMQWVCRLEQEFFAQGDLEKQVGLPASFLMDRSKPGVTDMQVGFFDVVVLPLFQTYVRAVPAANPMLMAIMTNYKRWQETPCDPIITSTQQKWQPQSSRSSTCADSCDFEQLHDLAYFT
jgi:hypothetical protein